MLSLLSVVLMGFSIRHHDTTCGSYRGGPTNNPVAHQYADYAWTNTFSWSCVYNIKDFTGNSDQERFNLARDAAFDGGGGVVFLPSGIYHFDEDLVLKDGVILRGESPPSSDAKSDDYSPPTKLIFPKYQPTQHGNGTSNETAFKTVRTENSDIDGRIGLINVDINRAAIIFGADIDKSHNNYIIIYGIRSNNVATPNPYVPNYEFQSPWLRFSDLLSANIKILAQSNVLIANNRLNDNTTDAFKQANYQIKHDDGSIETLREDWKVPFSYTNHYGISVNRFKDGSILFDLLATPESEPGLFRKGIVIRDNWVYHTMSVGIHASGDGLVIRNNVILDETDKRWYTDRWGIEPPYLNNPSRIPPNITYENRAIDWAGWGVAVEGNNYQVYKHFLGDTQDQSVDGEGILIQECCGGTSIMGANIKGNTGNSYIGIWKVPRIENVTISENKIISHEENPSMIYVRADTNSQSHRMENVCIKNNVISGGILAVASAGGSGNKIENNRSTLGGVLESSCHVERENNQGFQLRPCLPSTTK